MLLILLYMLLDLLVIFQVSETLKHGFIIAVLFIRGYGIIWGSGLSVSGPVVCPNERCICFLCWSSPVNFFSVQFSVFLVHGWLCFGVKEGKSEILITSWRFSSAVCGKKDVCLGG